jgi:hypothetical protein
MLPDRFHFGRAGTISVVKVRELIRLIEADGWKQVANDRQSPAR